MPADQPNVRDAKLIQYLNEAYGNEKRLENALQAHIDMAQRAPYKKRLRDHLTETKRHARELERRVKELGGSAESAPAVPGPTDIAGAVLSGMQKASALAQGPLHALRGTSPEERQLKNAKTEFAEESQEIGIYSAIQTFAEKVGDRATAALARSILRDEQRMAAFLEKEISTLANAVATAEIPARLRNGGVTRRRRAASRRTPATASRGTAARSRATTRPTTRATTRPTTRATSRPTSRSTSRAGSRAGTSARGSNGTQRAASSASGTTRRRRSSAAGTRRSSASPAAAR